jgi:hypothetical protein
VPERYPLPYLNCIIFQTKDLIGKIFRTKDIHAKHSNIKGYDDLTKEHPQAEARVIQRVRRARDQYPGLS